MSSKSKGSKNEREYKKILESQGYSVEKTRSGGKFGAKDFFNRFDLFALRKEDGQLVQVKTNQLPGIPVVEGIREFVCPSNIKKILAVRYDRGTPFYKKYKKHWRIIEVSNDVCNTKKQKDKRKVRRMSRICGLAYIRN